MSSERLILVTGATGRQGGAALRALRANGFAVRATTRDPDKPAARALAGEGVEVVAADFDDPGSLRRAMDGAHGVFAMTTMEHGSDAEVVQGVALADAAQTSRITHYVFTSVVAADQNTGIPHFETKRQIELHVQRLGFPYMTILRPGFFMENWPWQRGAIEAGRVHLPLSPGRKLGQIAVSDIGAFAALAFAHPDQWYRKAVDVVGDELSGNDVATALSTKIGRLVEYVQVPWDQFEQQSGHDLTVMFKWFEEKGYSANIDALRVEHSGMKTFPRWLNENWK